MALKKIYCIIPDNKKIETSVHVKQLKVVILVNLFYEDQVDFYREYLEKIPAHVDIVIISSKSVILDEFEGNRYQKIKKRNRGRDISALLVAAKEVISRYEYVCFIHDKKERDPETKEYVDLWKKNLWDNMLQSYPYVYNLLELFASTPEIGMLVPLPPYGRGVGVHLDHSWGENFERVNQLAEELGIGEKICYENPPITYSTVFWVKSQALKKLFSKNWKYSDFPAEPMKSDGEINHAIERILEYVVKDAGYEVKIALSASFAASFIGQLSEELNQVWDHLGREIGIQNFNGIDQYNLRVKKIRDFAKIHTDIYLYGGGRRGQECLAICRLLEIIPIGIIVTDAGNAHHKIEEVPVLPISDIVLDRGVGVIISASTKFQKEIERELKKRNFEEYIVF